MKKLAAVIFVALALAGCKEQAKTETNLKSAPVATEVVETSTTAAPTTTVYVPATTVYVPPTTTVAPPTTAYRPPTTVRSYSTPSAPAGDCVDGGSYTNSDGNDVHSPCHSNTGGAPAGATAQCRDGTYSFSQHRSGTCSSHGGVAQWL